MPPQEIVLKGLSCSFLYLANLSTPLLFGPEPSSAASHLFGAAPVVWAAASSLAADLEAVGFVTATTQLVEGSLAWERAHLHFATANVPITRHSVAASMALGHAEEQAEEEEGDEEQEQEEEDGASHAGVDEDGAFDLDALDANAEPVAQRQKTGCCVFFYYFLYILVFFCVDFFNSLDCTDGGASTTLLTRVPQKKILSEFFALFLDLFDRTAKAVVRVAPESASPADVAKLLYAAVRSHALESTFEITMDATEQTILTSLRALLHAADLERALAACEPFLGELQDNQAASRETKQRNSDGRKHIYLAMTWHLSERA